MELSGQGDGKKRRQHQRKMYLTMIAVKFMCTTFDWCIAKRKWLAASANDEMEYSKINTHSTSTLYAINTSFKCQVCAPSGRNYM